MEAKGAEEAVLSGQADIWKYMFGFVDSMALKCAVELRIADIIHSHSGPITLAQIASALTTNSTSPDINALERMMRFLVSRNIFTAHPDQDDDHHQSDGGDSTTLYGLTHSSRWLLHDSESSLAPMILFQGHTSLWAPWQCLSQCVKEGGIPFKKAHGTELWDFASQNPELNKLLNDSMESTIRFMSKAIISAYKEGFGTVRSLVDMGGGTGITIAEIVKSYPFIKGINFDLPHVIATAPAYHGVSHIGGDMFDSVPNADAIFIKWMIKDRDDEKCVKILKNCRKAIPEENGKLIIMDAVLENGEGNGMFDETRMAFDLLTLALTIGGKVRTKKEWDKILKLGGFPRYTIIKIPAVAFIIEAYPK